ncbi:uncharacterized protein NPIL_590691 [Nephila pilipes]|uniref:Uncharacterized protein n=1 Tax=Nephila pilipes TaxID=299642 RepID=A0A8X6UAE4_NEPPI|nr:uncharacterized protein NPIL_590691 [Nephila pilipes]
MNARFWPSLQLTAHVKIALGILQNIEFTEVLSDFRFENVVRKLQNVHENLSSLSLPGVMKKRTVCIVGALVKETKKWYNCHKIFFLGENLDFWNRIRWHSHGTINRYETARSLVQDENMDIKRRFYLASEYYLEENAQNLWRGMNEECRTDIISDCCTRIRSLWLEAVLSRNPLDWLQISDIIQNDHFPVENRNFILDNPLGFLRVYRRMPTPSARYKSLLHAISSRKLHQYDLYVCLFEMEDHELETFFNRFSTNMRVIVLKTFLHWPFQKLFLIVLERFRSQLWNISYLDLFKFILLFRFETEWLDYDYVALVKEMWAHIPSNVQSELKPDAIFPYLNHILENDGQECISIDFIRQYRRDREYKYLNFW